MMVEQVRRIEPRYEVSQYGLKGSLILFPDPRVISVQFIDISSVGVCISIVADIVPEQEGELFTLIAASKGGNYLPVQLFFNNVKIPVNLLNFCGGNKFGLGLSKHQKLLELAEKGRQFFQLLVETAVKKGASEADFTEHHPVAAEPPSPVAEKPRPAPEKQPAKVIKLPEILKELPPKHPVAELVKMRYEAFNRKVFMISALGNLLAPFYMNEYVKRDSEMARTFGDNVPLQKKTVCRWVPNELNLLVGGADKHYARTIEDNFKQAVYSYMLRKKQQDVSFDDIYAIFEGKLKEPFTQIRDAFLATVCKMIEPSVQARFDEYLADTSEEHFKAMQQKEEELLVQGMPPVDLVKNILWPKVMELGELAQYQKEIARSWVSKDQTLSIAEMGGVIVIAQPSYETFLDEAKKASVVNGERFADYFDEINLRELYGRVTENHKGEKKKSTFRIFVDTLQPEIKREVVMAKVMNSPEWGRYFVLKKSKGHFSKVFGVKSPAMFEFMEENMLTTTPTGEMV